MLFVDHEDLLTSNHIAYASNPEVDHTANQLQEQFHAWANECLSACDKGVQPLIEALLDRRA